MKKINNVLPLALLTACGMTFFGCKKDAAIPSVTKTTISSATVTTDAVVSITSTYAVSGGDITADGGAKVTDWGICWSTLESPTTASDLYSIKSDSEGLGIYTGNLMGLKPGTTYFVRAYATNSAGTAYGKQRSFITAIHDQIGPATFNPLLSYETVSDIDGNNYHTVKIGNWTWMAENLRTTKFNDGSTIPLVQENNEWSALSTPGYSWYNNDPGSYKDIYGALYNWYAVNTGKLCPIGWHIPDSTDYVMVAEIVGAGLDIGGALKENGINHWAYPNSGGNNESGWTALPGGIRSQPGVYSFAGFSGYWWYNVAPLPTGTCEYMVLNNNQEGMFFSTQHENASTGISVRCIKDN